MTREQDIRIIDLLFEREAEFLRVWEAEQAILKLLQGASFPFPQPPDLPSLHKPVRHASPSGKPPRLHAAVPQKQLRPLDSTQGENAYQLRYLSKNEKQEESGIASSCTEEWLDCTSWTLQPDVLEEMIRQNTEDFYPISVETVHFISPQEIRPIAKLWENPTASPYIQKENLNP